VATPWPGASTRGSPPGPLDARACPAAHGRRTRSPRRALTNPEAASAASAGIVRYEAQIAQAIPADDADLRAAIISAITLGITVSRHLVKADELATADPAQVIRLLRPCVLSLAARPDPGGPGENRTSE
jgi:hypothetical protein